MICVFRGRGKFGHRHVPRKKACKTAAEIGMMPQQAQECQGLPANHREPGERTGTDSPSEPAEGINLVDILISDFWPP